MPLESFAARALPRALTVAWMAVLAGLAVQLAVLAAKLLGAGGVTAAQFLADLAQGVSWSVIVCAGISLGTVLARARATVMGILGFLSGPLGWASAKGAQKSVQALLGLQPDQIGGFFYLVVGLKGVEYAVLAGVAGYLLGRPGANLRHHALAGFAVGLASALVFGVLNYRHGLALGSPPPMGKLASLSVSELFFPVGCALVIFLAARVKAHIGRFRDTGKGMPAEASWGARLSPAGFSGHGDYDQTIEEVRHTYGEHGRTVSKPEELLDANKHWARQRLKDDPKFFSRLSKVQRPQFLWIGCSDSRVPANQIVNLEPGQMFVHRNVANVVPHSDLNCLAVIQYAVEYLDVKHIVVVGHYGCGGVRAAMTQVDHGQIDNWLAHIKDVHSRYYDEINALDDPDDRFSRLCELNVTTQVRSVAKTSIVQNAWRRGKSLSVHGWIYDLKDGILRDLGTTLSAIEDLHAPYRILK
jgi:carbonic anhydrase